MTGSFEELLGELEAMPAFLDSTCARLNGEPRTPREGCFSFVEHAWHLADLEREGYGLRLRRLLKETDPFLDDFDGDRIARERSYSTKPLREGLEAFATARRENLALLRSLRAEALLRSGRQDGVGPLTLGDLPRMMREHDASHRQQIEALLADSIPNTV